MHMKKSELMQLKKAEAEKLLLDTGLSQKQIAKVIGISERSMSVWVEKYQWKRGEAFYRRPLLAFDLIINKGYKQKDAAKKMGVSERTMTTWKKNNFFRNL